MDSTGIIFDIKKFAIHDGPGIRTTVFLKGCPLDCWWCHNPEGRKDRPEDICVRSARRGSMGTGTLERFGREVSVDEVMAEIDKDIVFYDQSGGGATFSGGEPLMQPEFLTGLLGACRKRGIHTAVDTSGYGAKDLFDEIYDLVDLFLYDLKNMDDHEHIKYTGVSNRPILDNLKMLAGRGNKTILRLPLIPGITDTGDNIKAVVAFIEPLSSIRDISLLPYNRLAEDKLKRFNLNNRLGRISLEAGNNPEEIARHLASRGYRVKVGG